MKYTNSKFLKATNMKKSSTVKLVHNDHPRNPKVVAVIDRWSLFRGHLYY